MNRLRDGFSSRSLIWGVAVLFGVIAPSAEAFQARGRAANNPPPGAKKSRAEGDKPESDNGGNVGGDPAAEPFLTISLGDTVRTNTFALGLKKIQFEAVAGARIDARLKCEPGGIAPPVKLKAPSGKMAAEVAMRPGVAEAEVRGLELAETGLYTLIVNGVAVDVSNCELTTTVAYPRRLDRTIDLVEGRPVAIPLAGMTGRSLSELRIEAESTADPPVPLELVAEIRDPRGTKIDAGDRLKVAPSGDSVAVGKMRLDDCGTFNLYVLDRKRGSAHLRVKAVFDNPPAGSRTHTLD